MAEAWSGEPRKIRVEEVDYGMTAVGGCTELSAVLGVIRSGYELLAP
ncbi:hypothetical protein [Mycobacterium uberis]|nr:hypothetical protein [Mycobacterium uberis]